MIELKEGLILAFFSSGGVYKELYSYFKNNDMFNPNNDQGDHIVRYEVLK